MNAESCRGAESVFRTVLKMQERAKVCKERVVEDNSLKHERTGGENRVKLRVCRM